MIVEDGVRPDGVAGTAVDDDSMPSLPEIDTVECDRILRSIFEPADPSVACLEDDDTVFLVA